MVDVVSGAVSLVGAETIKSGRIKGSKRLRDGSVMPTNSLARRCVLHDGVEATYDRAYFEVRDIRGWLCVCRECDPQIGISISLDRLYEALQQACKDGYATVVRRPDLPPPAQTVSRPSLDSTLGTINALLDP